MELFLSFFRVGFFQSLCIFKYFIQRRTQHNHSAKFIHLDLGSWTDLFLFTVGFATPLVLIGDSSSTACNTVLAAPPLLPLMSIPELVCIKLVFLFTAHLFQNNENSFEKYF